MASDRDDEAARSMNSFTVEANRFQTPTPDHLEAARVVIAVVDGEILSLIHI